jgi:hypothetical protein
MEDGTGDNIHARSYENRLMDSKIFGFEILTAVTMKCTMYWDEMQRIQVEVYQCFFGTNCLHL